MSKGHVAVLHKHTTSTNIIKLLRNATTQHDMFLHRLNAIQAISTFIALTAALPSPQATVPGPYKPIPQTPDLFMSIDFGQIADTSVMDVISGVVQHLSIHSAGPLSRREQFGNNEYRIYIESSDPRAPISYAEAAVTMIEFDQHVDFLRPRLAEFKVRRGTREQGVVVAQGKLEKQPDVFVA